MIYINRNTEKIKEVLSNYKYVSFDIFDTLIKRYTECPEDVFELVGRILEKKYRIKISNYYEKRVRIEESLRVKDSFREIEIVEICRQIGEEEGVNENCLVKAEIEAEMLLSYGNESVKRLYDYCKENNKNIVIISNMYLGRKILDQLLVKNGYSSGERIFVSCEYDQNKRDGSLFRCAVDAMNINVSDMIHIGDDLRADCIGAYKAGISSVYIPTGKYHFYKNQGRKIEYTVLDNYIKNQYNLSLDPYYMYGYTHFGKLLAGFCKWMYTDVRNKGIKDVFFFSRDGYILRRAFDTLYEANSIGMEDAAGKIRSHYLYASRRALRVPYLWLDTKLETIVDKFPRKSFLTVDMFMENIGLSADEYNEEIAKVGLDKNTELKRESLVKDKRIIELFDMVYDDMVVNSKKEFDILVRYLRQERFCGRIAVVDIGWCGSLQFYLQEICKEINIDVEMHGYYIGLDSKPRKNQYMKGYIRDSKKNPYFDSRKPFCGLIEDMFMNHEGSTMRYEEKENGRVVPVLYPYEFINDEGNLMKESICISRMHEGAIDFIRGCKLLNYIDLDAEIASCDVVSTGRKPSKQDIRLFGDFKFMDVSMFDLAAPKNIIYYIKHPYDLKRDMECSRWIIGFMRKLFKLKLPYYEVYSIMIKIKHTCADLR